VARLRAFGKGEYDVDAMGFRAQWNVIEIMVRTIRTFSPTRAMNGSYCCTHPECEVAFSSRSKKRVTIRVVAVRHVAMPERVEADCGAEGGYSVRCEAGAEQRSSMQFSRERFYQSQTQKSLSRVSTTT